MAEGMKYEQDEIWAAIQRLHQRLVRLEVVHETKRNIPELAGPDLGDARSTLEDVIKRLGEKP